MPLDFSSNAILEKNKISSSDVWLLLLKINYSGDSPGYVCLNNASVTWPSSGGNVYQPAIFSLSGLQEVKDAEIPAITLSVIDIHMTIIPFLEKYSGGTGTEITIYVVHSAHLDNATPEFEEVTEVLDVSISHNYKITFKLGAENLLHLRVPKHRYLKNHCRFVFKGDRCSYAGAETQCNRTLSRCQELNNQANFGGFPGVGTMGVIV